MERLTTLILPLVTLLVGLLLGQASARPITIAAPASTTVAAASSDADRLTPYQRGQLIAQCYQTRIDGANQASSHLNQCLERMNGLP